MVELFAGEADVAEVRRSVDLGRLVNVLKQNAIGLPLPPSPQGLAVTKSRPTAGQGCEGRAMLTCSTINVFRSTDKSMNLSRAAMMPRRQLRPRLEAVRDRVTQDSAAVTGLKITRGVCS